MKHNTTSQGRTAPFLFTAAAVLAAALSVSVQPATAAATKLKTFASPGAAVRAGAAAIQSKDQKELIAIFGPNAKNLLTTGDPVADEQERKLFLQYYNEQRKLVPGQGGMLLVIGKQQWPFPIPVVKKGRGWSFDVNRGTQELVNRHIGENELNAIEVCRTIVDAQRHYVLDGHSGTGFREYARKLKSDPGKHDGLFWTAAEGDDPSPLGPLAAQAAREGYGPALSGPKPAPFHGYYYRILTAQGKNARGGAVSYLVNGHMTGGFALVAWPAEHGRSGVMTFIVNQDGVIYEKNLGPKTASFAQAMTAYDPGPGWKPSQ